MFNVDNSSHVCLLTVLSRAAITILAPYNPKPLAIPLPIPLFPEINIELFKKLWKLYWFF